MRSKSPTGPVGPRRPRRSLPEQRLALESFLPYRLNLLAGRVSLALSRIYAERHGITIPEWRVIATLGEYPALTATAIGRHASMHKTKVSRAVALLAGRGLLARSANTGDRREAMLSLTAAGRDVYRDLVPLALAFEQRLTAVLSDDEQQALDAALEKLSAAANRLLE